MYNKDNKFNIVKAMLHHKLNRMTLERIQALPPIYFKSLDAHVLQNLSDEILSYVTTKQAAHIPKEALDGLNDEKKQILFAKKNKGRALIDLQYLTPMELMNAPLEKVESSSQESIREIPTEHIPYAPFISEMLLKLTPSQISAVQNYQWNQVSPALIEQLSPEQKAAIRRHDAIPPTKFIDLSTPEKIRALHPSIIVKIRSAQLQAMPCEHVEHFQCAHINAFSNEQLASFRIEQLRFINALALSMNQLDFLLDKIRQANNS